MQRRGAQSPRLLYFPFKNSYLRAAGGAAYGMRSRVLPGNGGKLFLGNERPERVKSSGEFLSIDTAQHDVSAETLLLEEWIAADLHLRMRRLQL